MKFELRSALVAIAVALAAGPANAAMTNSQIAQLESLVASGDVFAMVEFWNANAQYFTFDSPLEVALRDFMAEVAQTGRAGDIPESLRQASRLASSGTY